MSADPNSLSSRLFKILLPVAIIVSFFLPLGNAPLFDLDEGAFSEATREMIATGNYLTTYLGGELRFDKPILIYWLQAVSVKMFGLNEFALRLPSALAATLWTLALYFFAKRFFGVKTAILAAFMMVSSLQVTIIAKAAIADALLNLFIALSMFSFFVYYKERQKIFLYATFTFIALGMLTKGPIAILIPFAVSFLFLAAKKELGFWLSSVLNPVGIAIFLLIAAPWYTAEYLEQKEKFIQGFFLKHNISRFQTSFEGHRGSLFYYIPVLIVGTLPFTSLLFRATISLKKYIKEELFLFFSLWFLFVLLFFSLSGTKLPHYIVYGYTPLFILMAMEAKNLKSPLFLLLPLLILSWVLLFLPEIASLIKNSLKDEFAKTLIKEAQDEFGLLWRLYLSAQIGGLFFLIFYRRMDIIAKIIAAGFLCILSVNFIVIPVYGAIAQKPIKEAALLAKRQNLEVIMWKIDVPSFMFYQEKIAPKREPKEGDIILTKITNLHTIKDYEIVYQKNGIVLARIIEK